MSEYSFAPSEHSITLDGETTSITPPSIAAVLKKSNAKVTLLEIINARHYLDVCEKRLGGNDPIACRKIEEWREEILKCEKKKHEYNARIINKILLKVIFQKNGAVRKCYFCNMKIINVSKHILGEHRKEYDVLVKHIPEKILIDLSANLTSNIVVGNDHLRKDVEDLNLEQVYEQIFDNTANSDNVAMDIGRNIATDLTNAISQDNILVSSRSRFAAVVNANIQTESDNAVRHIVS